MHQAKALLLLSCTAADLSTCQRKKIQPGELYAFTGNVDGSRNRWHLGCIPAGSLPLKDGNHRDTVRAANAPGQPPAPHAEPAAVCHASGPHPKQPPQPVRQGPRQPVPPSSPPSVPPPPTKPAKGQPQRAPIPTREQRAAMDLLRKHSRVMSPVARRVTERAAGIARAADETPEEYRKRTGSWHDPTPRNPINAPAVPSPFKGPVIRNPGKITFRKGQ